MAFEYKGRYYPTLASQRAAILRDEYKNNPAQLQAFQTIAQQQVKPQYYRQPNVKAQQDLKTWEIAKAFEKASQPAPAPAPAPAPPPAPAAPSVSQAAPAVDVTTQYTKQISDLQAQLAELEKAREQTTLDWETRSKQMEETLATQQAEYAKTLEALKIRSQEELASLTEASNLQIGGLEASLGGLRTELGTAGQTIESLQAQMLGQSQEFEKSLAQQLEQYNLLSASQKTEYESSIAQQLEKYQSLSEAQKQEYTAGLAAQQEQYQSLSASQKAEYEAGLAQQLEKYETLSAEQKQEYQQGLAAQQVQYEQGLATQKAEYQAGLANLTANQRAFQINQARAGQGTELQIQPATPTMPQISGTSAFKRRPRVVPMQISSQANLNVPTANVLNI